MNSLSGPVIELEIKEIEYAMWIGMKRTVEAIKAGKKDKYGIPKDKTWQASIEGALGEYVAAKVLNVPWPAYVNVYGNLPDLHVTTPAGRPVWVEVKTTGPRHPETNAPMLLVRPGEKDFACMVLVWGECPVYEVSGWILAKTAKETVEVSYPGGRLNDPVHHTHKELLNHISSFRAGMVPMPTKEELESEEQRALAVFEALPPYRLDSVGQKNFLKGSKK